MSHIFISHVEEDFRTAEALAEGLEAEGFQTWFYERDSAAGTSYLVQTREAIVAAQAVVLIISPGSLSSHQISKEVVRAHEAQRPIIPLLLGISDAEYKHRQPEWEEAVGAATSLAIPSEGGVARILPRVLRGLDQLQIKRGGQPLQQDTIPDVRPRYASPPPQALPPHPIYKLPVRALAAGAIAVFTLITGFINAANAVNPVPGGNEAAMYQSFPTVQLANVLANIVNGSLSTVVLFGCWSVYQSRGKGGRIARAGAAAMFAVSVLWILWVLIGVTSSANWRSLPEAAKSAVLGGTITIGVFALVLTGTMLTLFRKGE